MWTCRIRPFGADIRIDCDDGLVAAVEHQLSPWAPETSAEAGTAPVRITGTPAEGRYALKTGSRVLLTALSVERMMVGLQNWVDDEVTRTVTDLAPVHAGVVAFENRAILLPGPSGAGKSTLVAALVERGASYYSDELAFLDTRGRVHAYPRHMVMRDARGVGRPMPVFSSARAGDACPVGLILALRFEKGAAWRIERIPASEAALLLLANTAHRLSAVGIPASLLRAPASAMSYRGERGDIGQASDEILLMAAAVAR